MPVKRRVTAAEFDAARSLLNISAERIEAARAAMVEGKTLQAAADRYGWARQSVGDSVNVVWKALERYREAQKAQASAGVLLPPGWEQVTLIAPSELIEKFRAEIAKASIKPAVTKAK
jgi:hypothetical protein